MSANCKASPLPAVEDLPRHSVGWLEQPRDLGSLAITPEELHDRGTSSYSDLP